ncbi:molecular chaperone HscC [Sphingomonas sp. RIT328]|uniref:molecular chaperone HscC n=1 Tax=Sphingomonas sp. RIT328 TaxID=1470591 RepID=UPI00044E1663|nr:molecular chaperone HscC [Sphingomonas sp. RIT328]EZP54842.1 Heat shock protein Hsp70 [Sphingomonas sp. RIT328]
MIVGIDLGTTNSAVACFRNGAPELIPNALGELLTPSAVSLADDGQLLVGRPARDRQSTHPAQTATVFKRLMGTGRTTQLGRHTYLPEDLSALVLASLKRDAEAYLGAAVTHAVITVPAYFNDRQRKATRRAGEIAGFTVDRLINEPTAAALAYGIHDRQDREPFLVFDLGGGTFDVSVVEVFDGVVEVRASAGDNRLGGEDFNDVVMRLARETIDPADGLAGGARADRFEAVWRAAAERCRRTLSEAEEALFRIVWDGKEHVATLTAHAFEAAAEPLLHRLRDPVLRSLRDGGLRSDSLSDIVLVGGATRMPIVRRAVTRLFGRFPNASLHPDHAVALGAAVQAGLKARDAALEEVRLTDVCPFTLGVAAADHDTFGNLHHDVFVPIIERNSVVPLSRSHGFQTIVDRQTKIQFQIYQGEARRASDNVLLDTVEVVVPPRPAGEVRADVRFSYDASGLLEVDVTIPITQQTFQRVVSEGDGDADTLDARRSALAALKIHPREAAPNAAAMARAERCYESFLGDQRERIGQMVMAFQAVLDRQEPHAIADLRRELEAMLDAMEGERFL